MDTSNPFLENDPAGDYFVGREPELALLRELLDQVSGGNSIGAVLAGAHGRGKSSILQELSRLGRRADCIVVEAECDTALTHADQVSALLIEIARTLDAQVGNNALETDFLRGRDSNTFRTVRGGNLTTGDLRYDLRALSAVAVEELGAKGLVIAADEAQRLSPDLVAMFRHASTKCTHFGFVLAVRLMESTTDPVQIAALASDWLKRSAVDADQGDMGTAAFFNQIIPVGTFDSPVTAKKCVEKRLEKRAIKFDARVTEIIVKVADAIPRRIVQFAHVVYKSARDQGLAVADEAVLESAFRHHYATTMSEVESILDALSEQQKGVLSALIQLNGRATIPLLSERVFTKDYAQAHSEATDMFVSDVLQRVAANCPELKLGSSRVLMTSDRVMFAARLLLGP